jgi:hypothetical protein
MGTINGFVTELPTATFAVIMLTRTMEFCFAKLLHLQLYKSYMVPRVSKWKVQLRLPCVPIFLTHRTPYIACFEPGLLRPGSYAGRLLHLFLIISIFLIVILNICVFMSHFYS